MACTSTTVHSFRVAVIGGGAAGLSAARVLSRCGLEPVLLEKDDRVGGVWGYEPNDKTRPMYRGLRTNLPREIMGYREKPWGNGGPPGEERSYVTHEEVLRYLTEYKSHFGLEKYIRYGARVTQLKVLKGQTSQAKLGEEELPLFELEWTTTNEESQCQTFDAVCVANGHYAQPAFAKIEGIEHFRGTTLHSIEYDDPAAFAGQTVLCIGGRASGSDLAREISHHARKVYLSDTTCPTSDSWRNKVHWVPTTNRIHEDGSVGFAGGEEEERAHVDTIIFCTGYDYSFPFLTEESNLDLSFVPGERRVQPLYQQLWHARYPNLAFLGLPHSVLPFPLFELQVEAFAHQLLTQNNLPSLEERQFAAERDATGGGPKNAKRVQDTHFLGGFQWEYCRELAKLADNHTPEMERYLATNKAIYDHAGKERKALFPGGPDTYRQTRYTRDNDTQSFEVTATETKKTAAAEEAAV